MPILKPMIQIHDALTNTTDIREMTDEEFAAFQIEVAEYEAKKAAFEAKQIAKAQLLEKLGITAEEAKLLLS